MDIKNVGSSLSALVTSNNPGEALLAWSKMGSHSNNKAVIVSLPDYERKLYPDAISSYINDENSFLIPYFLSDKLYFFDNEIIIAQILAAENDVKIEIDYSIMFDTNFTSYVKKFVEGSNLGNVKDDFLKTVDVLIRGDFQYDYFFYLIENYKNIHLNNSLTPEDKEKKMADQYMNIVCMEMFKSLDKDRYISTGEIEYSTSRNEAIILADGLFNDLYNTEAGKKTLSHFIKLHQTMTLIIIGMLRVNFEKKTTANKKIEMFFQYIDEVVGVYYERETIVAHQYFLDNKNLKILSKANKKMKKDRLISLIENVAWDFTVPRIMEFFISIEGEGRFFLPFFLSRDNNLRELLKMFDIKGVLYERGNGELIPFTNGGTDDYFKNLNLKYDLDEFFSEERKNSREALGKQNIEDDFAIKNVELEKLFDAMQVY